MKFLQATLLIIFVNSFTYADTRSYDRTWLGLFGKSSVSDTSYIWNEIQARLDNDEFTLQQLLLRPGLLYKLNKDLETGLLYGFIETDRQREHRPTLQLTQTFTSTTFENLSLRNRLEFRKLEAQDALSIRYRGSLRYQRKVASSKSLVIWEEPFLNLTHEEWTGERIFERNRFFAGIGIEYLKTRMEIGYLNQFIPRSDRDITEHILTLYLFY